MSESKTEYHFKPKPSAIISMSVEERDKLVRDARRVALEDACKAVCHFCELEREMEPTKPSEKRINFFHQDNGFDYCSASPIRRLMETK